MRQLDYSDSKKVGRYVGPVLAILFLSEIRTVHIYEVSASPQIVYLNGFVLLLFGFYLVSIHNIWTRHWPVLITLSAWSATLLGLYRLFFPTSPQAPVGMATYVMLAVFAGIEIIITAMSYKK
ncbi:MAG TPA: hypothetical protein VGS08_00185 [Candidatus Saccharimonadales bacterium]|nr:hypothetical protein [Candidatus Saccharimonadales bacterium]